MESKVKIIENCLPEYLFKTFADNLMHPDFAWYYCSTAYAENVSIFGYSFHHTILFDGKSNSSLCAFAEPLIRSIICQSGDVIDNLIRIRAGMITVTHEPFVHSPHVDFYYPHKTGLFYINEADGDTIFYENKHDPKTKPTKLVQSKLKIKNKVDPKPNKVVIFDGLNYHSSSTPTKSSRRLVINFNYTTKVEG